MEAHETNTGTPACIEDLIELLRDEVEAEFYARQMTWHAQPQPDATLQGTAPGLVRAVQEGGE